MTQSEVQMMFDQLNKLTKQVEQLHKSVNNVTDKYCSDETKELDTAMSKAQGEFRIISSNKANPYFKSDYADWHTILNSARPALAKYGLYFSQQVRTDQDGAKTLHSMVRHASGQWIESRNRIMPLKNDPQSYGSMLTYMKRYDGMALLGITIADDAYDDDGERAMVGTREMIANAPSKHNPKFNQPGVRSFSEVGPKNEEVVGKDQLEQLQNELVDFPEIAERVMNAYNITSLADFPKDKFIAGLKRIQQIKTAEYGDK